ncbi:MAG TPA: type II toxin-antitoxin system RelE/ParE family toxin [Terracidiphilus sp.]|nr:type II toxin-antitoxin system RelE/ParE family toxin [Terracidiphilus sp.]
MTFAVKFTPGTRKDLRSIHDYIARNDSSEHADYVARKIIEEALSLGMAPARGAHPAELLALGRRDVRQVFFKPYRILYKVHRATIFIAVIADGRRDMQSLLARRLMS